MFRIASENVLQKNRKIASLIRKDYSTERSVPAQADVVIIGEQLSIFCRHYNVFSQGVEALDARRFTSCPKEAWRLFCWKNPKLEAEPLGIPADCAGGWGPTMLIFRYWQRRPGWPKNWKQKVEKIRDTLTMAACLFPELR